VSDHYDSELMQAYTTCIDFANQSDDNSEWTARSVIDDSVEDIQESEETCEDQIGDKLVDWAQHYNVSQACLNWCL